MGKTCFNPRTLDSEVMKDGLSAVGALDDAPSSKDLVMVTSGMAAQSYLPSAFRRKTCDIDTSVNRPLIYPEFREFVKPAADFLQDLGYQTDTVKGWASYQVRFSKGGCCTEGGEAAALEFTRRSVENYESKRSIIEREFSHARTKIVEGRNVSYKVASPEDVAAPKLVRSIGALDRNPNYCELITSGSPVSLSSEDVSDELAKIAELREEAVLHAGDPEMAQILRFASDIFDIRALSETTGFNERYLKDVFDSWDVLREREGSGLMLVNYLFPRLS